MKKMSKAVAAASALALATAGAPVIAVQAYAQDMPAASAQASDAAPAEAKAAGTWYVQSGIAGGGTGTADRPLNSFKDAYELAKPGDTIVCLNAVSILDGADGADDGVFALGKALTVAGRGDASALNARVPVALGANLTLQNLEFGAPKVYLRGYSLTMDAVKKFSTGQKSTPTVYGGTENGAAQQAGPGSVLKVTGATSDAFLFQDIYAGSEQGVYKGSVSIELASGATVVGGVYADGAQGAVDGPVLVQAGAVNVKKFADTHAMPGAAAASTLALDGFNGTAGVAVTGFDEVSLANGTAAFLNDGDFANNALVALGQGAVLDLSVQTSAQKVGRMDATEGSIVKLGKTGVLEIESALRGSFELRTPGLAADTSGPVEVGHVYVVAGSADVGAVTFKPFITQPIAALQKETAGGKTQWVARLTQEPIAAIGFTPVARVAIKKGTTDFVMAFADAQGRPLAYDPSLDIVVKDPQGHELDPNDGAVWAYQDDADPAKLHVEVLDESMAPGTYALVFTDVVTDTSIERAFDFYNQGATVPGLGLDAAPTLSGPDSLTVEQDAAFDPLAIGVTAHDAEDGDIALEQKHVAENTVDTAVPGEYRVVFTVADSKGASTTKTVKVTVTAKQNPGTPWEPINAAPVISASDRTIEQGSAFDPMEGVTAHDAEDGPLALTAAGNVASNTVDVHTPGTYEVVYTVSDSKGASAIKTVKVTVTAKPGGGDAGGDNGSGNGGTGSDSSAGQGGNDGTGATAGTPAAKPNAAVSHQAAAKAKAPAQAIAATNDPVNLGVIAGLAATVVVALGLIVFAVVRRRK